MSVDFPNNPTIGDRFDFQGTEWQWDGVAWTLVQALGIVDWDDIENKPSTFPPSAHQHVVADITDFNAVGDARYLRLTGGILTGALTVRANTVLEGGFRVFPSSPAPDVFGIGITTGPIGEALFDNSRFDGGAGGSLGQIDIPGEVQAQSDQSLLRRLQADNRYLRLIGGTLTGPLILTSPADELMTLQIRARASDGINDLSFRDSAGNVANRWDIRATISPTGSLALRRDGTTWFSLLSTGFASFVGSLQAASLISLAEIQTRTDANPSHSFRSAAGVLQALAYLNRGSANVDRAGLITWNLYNPDGSAARVVGTLPDTIARGGTLGTAQTIVTREHGDLRYPLIPATVQNIQAVFTGDANTLIGPNFSGSYFCNTTAVNTPGPVNGQLLVLTHPSNGNFRAQLFIEATSSAPRIWYRAAGSGTWSGWALIAGKQTHQALFTGDLDTILIDSEYTVDLDTATNVPIAGGFGALRTQMSINNNAGVQMLTRLATNVTYTRTRSGSVWGAWTTLEGATEFHDPANIASWRISGNTLECWGTQGVDASGNRNFVYPKGFARNPVVTATGGIAGGGTQPTQTFVSVGLSSCTVGVRLSDGNSSGVGVVANYHAIGEWDGL